ncbi:uncharacterized protein LOC117537878 isoform X2 [Gymnodraco acuticeps]|uniref:Uncharacterized protein LOC117537878 isoform X2 n=1 Tax=Gymnodraco acuticeps TaxID=8218 RepID=A0A6P8TRX0_GYMAC|nr:uncharacterized protein LOC117537878 isoform X2 [Gymnodraco acuticeps]
MSVFDRPAPLIPQVSASSRQTNKNPSVCVSPPLPLSSPVITKKAIQIPSFDEKGLIYEKHNTKPNSDRSFLPICSPKSSTQPFWGKSCTHSEGKHGERASTLPRAKPKTCSSPIFSAKPSVSIVPAPKPNSSPTLKPKPSDSLHLPASQFRDPSPLFLQQPHPKLSVSPTLTVPTPRLSPSPTSLCQRMSLDSRGGKTPSPVGVERRARQITISNTTVEPDSIKQRSSDEAKHDILDQEALLDFTHPALRTACSISRHQTNSESQTQVALSQSSCLMQGNAGLSKRENIAQDKPKPPPRNIDNTSIPKPKPNIKKQQGFLPSGARGTQTSLSESEGIRFAKVVQRESAFDVLATQSSLNLHRKRTEDYPQRRNYASNEQYELNYSDRNATTSKISFSTEPLPNQSPTIEKRRRLFDLSKDTKVDATFLSNLRRPKKENNIQTATGNVSKLSPQTTRASCQKHRFWWKDPLPVNQSVCVSKDYSCQSRDIDRETDSHSLNQYKTCLVVPQTQKASGPASIECATSKTILTTPDTISHKNKEMNLCVTGVSNQTDIFAPSGLHGTPAELLEYPSEKYCPFNTNSVGIRSKGVFDLPLQHTVYQRPDQATTTTAFSSHTPDYPPAGRAFIMEEPEDPYYVTMYYPGSVYVGEYRDIQKHLTEQSEEISQSTHGRDSFIFCLILSEVNNVLSKVVESQTRGFGQRGQQTSLLISRVTDMLKRGDSVGWQTLSK